MKNSGRSKTMNAAHTPSTHAETRPNVSPGIQKNKALRSRNMGYGSEGVEVPKDKGGFGGGSKPESF